MNLKEEFAKVGHTEGVYHLSGGERGFTFAFTNDDGTYSVRYEHGWYCEYENDGTRPYCGIILRHDGTEELVPGGTKRNIVRFEPISWSEAREKYPRIAQGFKP